MQIIKKVFIATRNKSSRRESSKIEISNSVFIKLGGIGRKEQIGSYDRK